MKKVIGYNVTPKTYEKMVNFLANLPYATVAGLMEEVKVGTIPVYEEPEEEPRAELAKAS